MSANTRIEWTDTTWNVVRGCSRVSPGCDKCYAIGQAHRFSGPGKPYEGLTVLRPKDAKRPGVDWSGVVRFVPEMLGEPLRWRDPKLVFVNSMSDLFHDALEDWQIDRVFGVMWATLFVGRSRHHVVPGHTYQVLTKRPARALDYLSSDRRRAWADAAVAVGGGVDPDALHDQTYYHAGPHPRIWLGVSAENQATANKRIPLLLRTPAAVRFVSAEPLLGPLDLAPWLERWRCKRCGAERGRGEWSTRFGVMQCGHCMQNGGIVDQLQVAAAVDWVIVGGESGNGARPFDTGWARSIVRQCKDARVACFVKQLGARPGFEIKSLEDLQALQAKRDLKQRKWGDPQHWPEDLRVREFPAARREHST